jgi:L-alanine-DL-glutamate epimerase-like enolase superfamily enzyme
MQVSLRLLAANLHYPKDLQVHTAASGPVEHLAARYLLVERSDGWNGIGEVRANITYLSKLPESAVDPAVRDLCRRLPWTAPAEDIAQALSTVDAGVPRIACAAIESALMEGMARSRGITVAELLGGKWSATVETNQCLFWSPNETFDLLTERFLAEGFRHLKARIAVGSFAEDVARLRRLRERAGPSVSIAADANGAWTVDEAVERLRVLEPLNLSYIEQPTHPGDWDAFEAVLKRTSIPLMVDEGLMGDSDIARLARIGAPALAHLKIVKLGGPSAVVSAMRRLGDAGVRVMIGQMNEGAMATALATHCVMALKPAHAELYGCYGLLDDVTSGVAYQGGSVRIAAGPGLGVSFNAAACREVWVENLVD